MQCIAMPRDQPPCINFMAILSINNLRLDYSKLLSSLLEFSDWGVQRPDRTRTCNLD